MAKKTKKQARKAPSTRPAPSAVAANGAATPAAPASTSISGRGYEVEFRPDYSETIKDLKRIGILASSFFVILLVLAFFLR
jgi:hypothetical protein